MTESEHQQFVISSEDWSLHRKGHDDQKRHQEKVQEAIRNNLPDLITEESIIMSDGRDVVKIPIRSLDEYKSVIIMIRINMSARVMAKVRWGERCCTRWRATKGTRKRRWRRRSARG